MNDRDYYNIIMKFLAERPEALCEFMASNFDDVTAEEVINETIVRLEGSE